MNRRFLLQNPAYPSSKSELLFNGIFFSAFFCWQIVDNFCEILIICCFSNIEFWPKKGMEKKIKKLNKMRRKNCDLSPSLANKQKRKKLNCWFTLFYFFFVKPSLNRLRKFNELKASRQNQRWLFYWTQEFQ